MSVKKKLTKKRLQLLHEIEEFLEGPMVFLGFVWLVLLIVELTSGLSPAFEKLSLLIWIIFIVDFLIKLILAPQKTRFLKSNLLTAVSLAVPALRLFRIVRFFRVFRVLRGTRLLKVVASINRSMKSLNAAMKRRGFVYVVLLTIGVAFGGAAGMFAFENDVPGGLKTYWSAVWWTVMLIITIGSEYWPQTAEGRILCILISLYGFAVFGYITAALASFFVGRDAEENSGAIAGTRDVGQLKKDIQELKQLLLEMKGNSPKADNEL